LSLYPAIRLAHFLHRDQVDKAGVPYVDHLAGTFRHLTRLFPDWTEAEGEAAWLHDSMEDQDATEDQLVAAGVSSYAAHLVLWLSHSGNSASYLNYINRIAARAPVGVLRVKIADNEDNSDPVRVGRLASGAEMVRTKYAPAREILESALKRRTGK